jgi:homocysteine S-methyltransferase
VTSPLQPFLDHSGVVILDGAMATELERRGADLADPLWSAKILLEGPDLIRDVHADYYLAGADVAITASYQASFDGFARRGLNESQAANLMHLSVRLAQQARDAFWRQPSNRIGRLRPIVAASVGPYGAYLADGSEYRGNYGLSEEELIQFHRPRIAALLEAEPDLLACETIPTLVEARALVRLLAEYPAAQAWLSFSCCDEKRTCGGELFADCVAEIAASPQIVAIGLNCTPPQHVVALLTAAAAVTNKPLIAYPNSGEVWDSANHCWVAGTGAAHFAAEALRWRAAGASTIGGCCRTTPADIAELAALLRQPRTRLSAHISTDPDIKR